MVKNHSARDKKRTMAKTPQRFSPRPENRELVKLRAEVIALRVIEEEAEKLLNSLGEYVRQSMHLNPEWRSGIATLSAALVHIKRVREIA